MRTTTAWLNGHTAFLWWVVLYLLVVVACAVLGHVSGIDQSPTHGVPFGSTS